MNTTDNLILNHVVAPATAHINLSPVLFRFSAQDYLKCYLDFKSIRRFSAVPFFLCCRAIELALKAMHLETKGRDEVKKLYMHNLSKLYGGLELSQQTLSPEEVNLLDAANDVYTDKGFEYLQVWDAGTRYKRFPDIDKLATLARKIVDQCEAASTT